jgi:hypothetical protein
MIADNWRRDRTPAIPWIWDNPPGIIQAPTRKEFEALKKELEELKEKLKAGKKQDEEEGNPDCEMEEKIEFLRRLGTYIGVDFDEVFKSNDNS